MHAGQSRIVVWAVVLFFGFHLLGELIGWSILQYLGVIHVVGPLWFWEEPDVFYAFAFVFPAVSYLYVRRLGHDVLSNLWLYVVVVGVIGLIASPLFDSVNTRLWAAPVFALARSIALVWFARRLSAISFRHSLLLIGLATAIQTPVFFVPPHLHVDPGVVWTPLLYITQLAGGVLSRSLAVWSLVNAQAVTSSTRTALLFVLTMVILAAGLFGIISPIWIIVRVQGWSSLLYLGVSSVIAPVLAVVITYAVRVRISAEPEAGLKSQSS